MLLLESLRRVYTYMEELGHSFSWPMMIWHVVFCVVNSTAVVLSVCKANKLYSFLLYNGNEPHDFYADLYWLTIGIVTM